MPRTKSKNPKSISVGMRVDSAMHAKLNKIAANSGGVSALLRHLAEAVIDGRIVVGTPHVSVSVTTPSPTPTKGNR